ncbi:integral membrane protein [Paenibacillus algorifonticola]|uniref:Integral membrane protein n=1 Tax=Paenibacillus algorifonticola TaxID=684063 RepID=A0A1I2FS89_9BACL|nr:MFS transporter [Paenibacillus algorifonticola]SFF07739.1 integral membrane protein [Paenibacillus algorifonticola]
MRAHPIYFLRMTGLLDGISLLVLLGIAMPLKYIWGFDRAVTIVGSIHGGIFCLYAAAILYAAIRVKWSLLWSAAAVIAAFVPFGNFVLDWKLKKVQAGYSLRTFNYSVLVYSIVFFSFFDLFSQLPVMSTFAASVGASSFIVGFVIGLYSLSNTFGNILSGIMTDRIGPFKILMAGLLLSSTALLLYHFVEEPLLLIIVRILHGFVAGLIVPAAFTFSANTTINEQQGKKVAFTGTFVGLAAIIGPAFSGIMASKTSVPFVFTCVAVLGFALAILSAIFLSKYKIPKKEKGEAAVPLAGSIWNAGVIKAYGGAFFLMFSQGVIAYLLPLHVQSLGYDSRLSGTLMSTFGIIAVLIFVLPTNRIFDRIAPSITLALGIGLMGLSQLLISQATTTLTLYSVLGLYGVGFAFLFPSINTMLIRATPAELRGKAYGYFYAFFSLGVVVGSSLLGWLPFNTFQGFMFTGAVLLLFAAFVALNGKKDRALSY